MAASWRNSRENRRPGRNGRTPGGPGATPTLEVKVAPEQPKNKDTTIYITVDNSGSMQGPKLKQVIKSIGQIVDKAPHYFRFVFRSFSDEVALLVTKKKQYLDMGKVYRDLRKTGGMTALYDAWGQTLKEIDRQKLRSSTDNVYVLIFTDGQDNASKEYRLSTVLDLVAETIKYENAYFSFVQAGKETKAVAELEAQFPAHSRCQVISVENSAEGIEFAFEKVHKNIQLVFRIEMSGVPSEIKKVLRSFSGNANASSNSKPWGEPKILEDAVRNSRFPPYPGTRGTVHSAGARRDTSSQERSRRSSSTSEPEVRSEEGSPSWRAAPDVATSYPKGREDSRFQDPQRHLKREREDSQSLLEKRLLAMENLCSSFERQQLYSPFSAAGAKSTSYMSLGSLPYNPPRPVREEDYCSTLGIEPDGTPKEASYENSDGCRTEGSKVETRSSSEQQSSSSWKLRVGNIPAQIESEYVVYSFSKTGPCELFDSGNDHLPQTRWVILTYPTEKLREDAFLNMGGHTISGKVVTVARY